MYDKTEKYKGLLCCLIGAFNFRILYLDNQYGRLSPCSAKPQTPV